MIKKEFNMLRRGDRVKYTGKGKDRGIEGIVDEIYNDGDIAVIVTSTVDPFYALSSYKFWKFINH